MVFVSYSGHDAQWRRRFDEMLSPIVRNRPVEVWIDERNESVGCVRVRRHNERWPAQQNRALHAAQNACAARHPCLSPPLSRAGPSPRDAAWQSAMS